MDQILANIFALIKSSSQSLNSTIAGLPPIQQFEAASEAASILRQMNSSANWLKDQFTALDGYMAELKNALPEAINKAAETKAGELLQTKLSAAEYVKKSDADAAQQVAVTAAENAIRNSVQKIGERRASLITGDGAIPAAVAGLLSDEVLLADDFKVRASKAADRVKKLGDLGVEVPAVLAESANLAIDEAGEKAFGDKFALFQGVAAKHGGKPGTVAGAGESQEQGAGTGNTAITAI